MAGVAMVRDKYAVRLQPEQREELQHLIRSARVPPERGFWSDDGWAAPHMWRWALCIGSLYWGGAGEGPAGRPTGIYRGDSTWSLWPAAQRRNDHWTLRLLAGKVVELGLASSMSHEGVRKRLKKTLLSRGRRRSGASPR